MEMLIIEAPISPSGEVRLKDIRVRVQREASAPAEDGLREAVVAAPADDIPLIVRAYEHLRPDSATRRLLELLPGGRANGLTPEELGQLFDPALSKASVRAVIRNGQRLERNLGVEKETLFRIDFDHYRVDQAGRYFVELDARRALDDHLGR
jgi:hypothetical protein